MSDAPGYLLRFYRDLTQHPGRRHVEATEVQPGDAGFAPAPAQVAVLVGNPGGQLKKIVHRWSVAGSSIAGKRKGQGWERDSWKSNPQPSH